MTFQDILMMTAATVGYVLITAVLWKTYWKKEKRGEAANILVGLIYGACSIAANHLGIELEGVLVLNVRDIGPLAAGLFFSPVSGVISGVIGGAERILAGEIWGIGRFTEIACGLSTFLAGIFAALLNRLVYEGKRVPATQAFFLGAVTEVFHMYAILFTNRSSMNMAYSVVQSAAVPMILFTAAGLFLCAAVIRKLAGDTPDLALMMDVEKVPLRILFQRALLVVTLVLFAFNFVVSYNLETRLVNETIENEMESIAIEKKALYDRRRATDAQDPSFSNTGDYEAIVCLAEEETGDAVFYTEDGLKKGTFQAGDMGKLKEALNRKPVRMQLEYFTDVELLTKVAALSPGRMLIVFKGMFTVYEARDAQIYESTLSDILLFTVLYMLVAMLADRLVVRNLQRVNASLRKITGGNLNETVWVHSSAEFTELSEDINKTVTALRGYIDRAERHMKEELQMAATIQDASLPKNFRLPSENIELYALMKPAKSVGGDFYDFFYIDMNQLCLVIADVSGKGIPAALFMMRVKTAIKNYARSGLSPAEMMREVNRTLCDGNDADMFVTVWIGILNLHSGVMHCSNAGHEYPLISRAGGDYELLKDKHSLPLAVMEEAPMKEYELQLMPGDQLFVYTDGVPEAINEKEEAYGTDRLTKRLSRVKNVSQQWLLEDALQDIRNFAGEAEQFDDITMLGLTFRDKKQ